MSKTTNSNAANSNCDDVEYFPRRKRAPYLHDISDFGILRTHHHLPASLIAADDHLSADNMGNIGGLASSAGASLPSSSSLSLLRSSPTKSSTSAGESGGGTTSQLLRRKSSFARVFSTLRMTIAEDGGGDVQLRVLDEDRGAALRHCHDLVPTEAEVTYCSDDASLSPTMVA